MNASSETISRCRLREGDDPHVVTIPAVSPAIAAAMPLDIIEHRPDIRRAERELAAATARIDVARADLYPRVSLLGTFGHRSDDTSNLLKTVGGYWSFGPALRWPLLTGGGVHGKIDAAMARRDRAEAAFQQSILRAMEDVENSLAGYGRDQQEKGASPLLSSRKSAPSTWWISAIARALTAF